MCVKVSNVSQGCTKKIKNASRRIKSSFNCHMLIKKRNIKIKPDDWRFKLSVRGFGHYFFHFKRKNMWNTQKNELSWPSFLGKSSIWFWVKKVLDVSMINKTYQKNPLIPKVLFITVLLILPSIVQENNMVIP